MDGSGFLQNTGSAQIEIVTLTSADFSKDAAASAEWDAFVTQHPEGSPFHRLAWQRAVKSALGYDTPCLMAKSKGTVVGVLPLVHAKTPLFGNSLISTGFSVGGGVLADDDAVALALSKAAIAIAEKKNVDCLELRSEKARFDGWPTKSETYASFKGPIGADEDERLKAIPRKKRADVRKGIKKEFDVNTNADVKTFYHLYATNLSVLGTPILPLKWYKALATEFGDDCEISTISNDGKAVVALMSFYHGETVYPYYVGSMPEARKLHAYDHIYFDLMGRAFERGYKIFDFGRSKYDTGAFDYKKFWGFEPQPLEYQYHLVKADDVPDVNPNNPKYAAFVKIWKKLPLRATTLIGPHLARQLA